MILLVLFAFLAGIITVLSPCILPILPIILTSTIGGEFSGRARPVGVVIGFILSFTFFTLFLSTIVRLSGIPADALRFISIFTVAGFGLSLLIPQFQVLVERMFSKFAGRIPSRGNRPGLGGGLIIGFSVGLLWTPCVGPILASVISLAITGTVTLDTFFITVAYAMGTAIPMFLIMLGGQNALRRVPWLLSNLGKIQKVFGILMILTALGIYFNIDRKFQTFVLDTFPQYGTGLTRLEDNELIRKQLDRRTGVSDSDSVSGKPMFDLTDPQMEKAPELVPGGLWFNSEPLTLEGLRGKVVLIDFWTYSCINCQRTFPYLRAWHERYSDHGLVIIGVHSPEFEFEKRPDNVAQAIEDFSISYPVVQDNEFATWRSYKNRYWPAKYIIDAQGYIRFTRFGEGAYDETEKVIQDLLREAGEDSAAYEIQNPQYTLRAKTPETYLGYKRLKNFASPEVIQKDVPGMYTVPSVLGPHEVAYGGNWTIMSQYANPQIGAFLELDFEAREVYLVMRSKSGKPTHVTVYIDDNIAGYGTDNVDGAVTVTDDRLYTIIQLPEPGRHLLRLEFMDSDTEVYAVTFG